MSTGVLIVDDSAFMRKIIKDIIDSEDNMYVTDYARNGEEALEKIKRNKPDLITMDIEMPVMDGIETLEIINKNYEIPVIMLSSYSKEGNYITIKALEIGALDFIEKPSSITGNDFNMMREELVNKIKNISMINRQGTVTFSSYKNSNNISKINKIRALAFGASTGGPKALLILLRKLPKNINVPVFIVQHMPRGFTASFANRLNTECPLEVLEAQHGMVIKKNVVYMAPGDYHMTIKNGKINLNQNEKLHGVRPAVDVLFESLSEEYSEGLLAVLLTGMGKDGTLGMKKNKSLGGYNIAQDEKSSTIYGMPKNAVINGVVDEVLSLEQISEKLKLIC